MCPTGGATGDDRYCVDDAEMSAVHLYAYI